MGKFLIPLLLASCATTYHPTEEEATQACVGLVKCLERDMYILEDQNAPGTYWCTDRRTHNYWSYEIPIAARVCFLLKSDKEFIDVRKEEI